MAAPVMDFVTHLIFERTTLGADRIAARCRDRVLSYAALGSLVRRMGGVVAAHGVGQGQRVLVVLPDSFSFLAGFLGSLLLGAVVVPIHSRLPKQDYSECIAATGPTLVIASPGHCALEAARDANTPTLAVDDDRLDALTADAAPASPAPVKENDVCLIMVTSGTTGHPKLVPHTRDHFLAVARHIGDFMGLVPDDVVLCSAKMSHAYGLFFSLILPLWTGATVVLCPDKPTAADTLRLLRQERVTVFGSVPALLCLLLLSLPQHVRFDSLRTCVSSGETLPEAVHNTWQQSTGCDLWLGYGTTEFMTFVLGSRPPGVIPATTGKAIPPYEAVVLDANHRPVPDGTSGHLALKGPTAMTGYCNASQWTQRVFTPDGYLLTGDMAVRHDGTFTILGRMDDMFKAGGLWVSPTRVENALLSHEAVAQCAVTGGMSGALSLVRAHVVLKDGWPRDEAVKTALQRQATSLLPQFMVPADIVFHDALPLTPSGKIQRFKLRQPA